MKNFFNEAQQNPLSNVFYLRNPSGTKQPISLQMCLDITGCSTCVFFKPWVNFGANCRTRAALEEQRDFLIWAGRMSKAGGDHE